MNSTEFDNADAPNAAVLSSPPLDQPKRSSTEGDDASTNPFDRPAVRRRAPSLRLGGTPAPPRIPYHPLTELLHLAQGQEFADLVQSIKDNGPTPIPTVDGMILDPDPYRACLEAGVEPTTEPFVGDPHRFVYMKHLHRVAMGLTNAIPDRTARLRYEASLLKDMDDLVPVFRQLDRSGLAEERLARSIRWFKEFFDGWESPHH